MKKISSQQEDILRTVAYFTAIGQPVTATDVWLWQMKSSQVWSLQTVTTELNRLKEGGRLVGKNGWFTLPLFPELLKHPAERYRASDRKFRVARRYAKWLRCIPGVRAVSVCNSLAWEMAKEDSDIDLFVVTRDRALWSVRFFALLPLRLLKRRPGHAHSDPICLSFFVSDSALDLGGVRKQPSDPHFAHWTLSMIPIVDDGVMDDFFRENAWAWAKFPNATRSHMARYRRPKQMRPRFSSSMSKLEGLLRPFQEKRLPSKIQNMMNKSTDVVVNESMLKFHTNDRRDHYRDLFESLCQK